MAVAGAVAEAEYDYDEAEEKKGGSINMMTRSEHSDESRKELDELFELPCEDEDERRAKLDKMLAVTRQEARAKFEETREREQEERSEEERDEDDAVCTMNNVKFSVRAQTK